MKNAAIDQFIILLLFIVGSIVSSFLQHRKKEQNESGTPPGGPLPRRTGEVPIPPWPATAKNWQDELKRLLTGEMAPPTSPAPPRRVPPVFTPTVAPPQGQTVLPPIFRTPPRTALPQIELSEGDARFETPLVRSATVYEHARQMAERVRSHMEGVDRQTERHKPTQIPHAKVSPGFELGQRWRQKPETLKEALVASIVFGPPRALEPLER